MAAHLDAGVLAQVGKTVSTPTLLRTATGTVDLPADHPSAAWYVGALRCARCGGLLPSCAEHIRHRPTGEVWHPACLTPVAVTTGQHELPGL